MRQFGKIFKFELKNYFTNKIFMGITVFLVVLIAIVMFFPRITETIENAGDDTSESSASESAEAEDLPVMLIVCDAEEHAEAVREVFSASFIDYTVKTSQDSLETVKKQITDGEVECAFVLDSFMSYTYYVDNLSIHDSNTVIADEALQSVYRMNAMISGGISAEEAQNILSVQIEHKTETLGKDQMKNYFYTYIMIMALYMVILIYCQMVATNVATEKSSRAMELLVTSAKPISMMFGKVFASCLAGLTQIIAVFGTAIVCFNANKNYWDASGIVASIFNMPAELLIYMIVFFILGFLVYAFMMAAVGSTASKLEDINTSLMPIMLLFIISFIVVMFAIVDGNVDNMLMKVCSYVPFTSSIAMFTRIAMSTVPWYEIVISIAILIVSVIGIGIISAKIYRVCVMLYGTPPKMKEILKAIKNA